MSAALGSPLVGRGRGGFLGEWQHLGGVGWLSGLRVQHSNGPEAGMWGVQGKRCRGWTGATGRRSDVWTEFSGHGIPVPPDLDSH